MPVDGIVVAIKRRISDITEQSASTSLIGTLLVYVLRNNFIVPVDP